MTPAEIAEDGRRSYDVAIAACRQMLLEPTREKLVGAIATLRGRGETVTLAEQGDHLTALWDVGRYRKLGYHAVIRLAKGQAA